MPHADAGDPTAYCQGCAEGPFPIAVMHLVTWNEDPYWQTDDGDLTCVCSKCRLEREKEEA